MLSLFSMRRRLILSQSWGTDYAVFSLFISQAQRLFDLQKGFTPPSISNANNVLAKKLEPGNW
jgi:ABC-type phosphate/phosphonate transport system permease subunit